MGEETLIVRGYNDLMARHLRSLYPLSLEEALGGAMQTGKPPEPEPQNKHAKRTATKRRLKGSIEKAGPGR
jgi:hypothetical protein